MKYLKTVCNILIGNDIFLNDAHSSQDSLDNSNNILVVAIEKEKPLALSILCKSLATNIVFDARLDSQAYKMFITTN